MPLDLKGKTVVVLGASSGIGRATALGFAREGANVVVAARRQAALESLAADCRQLGIKALAFPLDITDKGAVEQLAAQTFQQFGSIDVWVSNAGVYMMGRFDQIPYEEFRRVIEVNFMGYVNAAYAVLPYFKRQGHGNLIMTGSLDSKVTYAYVSPYAASKHAVYGFATTLRQDLLLDPQAKDIHVSVVMPASIDTPLFEHTANHTGRKPRAMSPVYPPEQVARTIIDMAKVPRREAFVGNAARVFRLQWLMAPALAERLFAVVVDKMHLFKDQPAPDTAGNLFQPVEQGDTTDGGWGSRTSSKVRTVAGVVLGGAVPAVLLWRRLQGKSKKGLLAR